MGLTAGSGAVGAGSATFGGTAEGIGAGVGTTSGALAGTATGVFAGVGTAAGTAAEGGTDAGSGGVASSGLIILAGGAVKVNAEFGAIGCCTGLAGSDESALGLTVFTGEAGVGIFAGEVGVPIGVGAEGAIGACCVMTGAGAGTAAGAAAGAAADDGTEAEGDAGAGGFATGDGGDGGSSPFSCQPCPAGGWLVCADAWPGVARPASNKQNRQIKIIFFILPPESGFILPLRA